MYTHPHTAQHPSNSSSPLPNYQASVKGWRWWWLWAKTRNGNRQFLPTQSNIHTSSIMRRPPCIDPLPVCNRIYQLGTSQCHPDISAILSTRDSAQCPCTRAQRKIRQTITTVIIINLNLCRPIDRASLSQVSQREHICPTPSPLATINTSSSWQNHVKIESRESGTDKKHIPVQYYSLCQFVWSGCPVWQIDTSSTVTTTANVLPTETSRGRSSVFNSDNKYSSDSLLGSSVFCCFTPLRAKVPSSLLFTVWLLPMTTFLMTVKWSIEL